MILLAILELVRNVLVDGYLPDPFLHYKFDTFMDWYHPAYWANNPGTYSEWRSIYPPFSFVFLRFFTNGECYAYSVDASRECDPTGIVLVNVLTIVNFFLVWRVFHKIDRSTAFPRALAVGLGFPSLFAWERGNLIIPCFTAFILANGNLLTSARLKAFCTAITLSFKPYLIVALAGRFVKQDWIRLEWAGLWFIAIYAASYAIFGAGDPMSIIGNMMDFEHAPGIDLISFTTTYTALMTMAKLPLPIIAVVGSGPVDLGERYIPLLIYAGAIGTAACLAYATWRPTALTHGRITALVLILLMSFSTAPGGYSLQFVLLFVFSEKWRGPSRIVAMICAYLWCIPADFPLLNLYNDSGPSFLAGHVVHYPMPITAGELLRPGLLLIMEYALVCASVGDIFRDLPILRRAGRWPPLRKARTVLSSRVRA